MLALSISVPSGYNLGSSLLFIISIYFLFFGKNTVSINFEDKAIFLILLLYFIGVLISVYIESWSVKELDRPSRFVLSIPVFVLLLNARGKIDLLWYGSIIGAMTAFVLALYERNFLSYHRAQGDSTPIMFGNIGMMLGLINFAAASYYLVLKRYLFVTLALISALSGIGISVLSGSRGGWIALPLIGVFILWNVRDLLGKKLTIKIFCLSIFLIFSAILIPQTDIKNRLDSASDNFFAYIQGENKITPVGQRLEMWKAGWVMFRDSPIFGVGNDGSVKIKKKLIEDGVISSKLMSFTHVHNEFIESLSKRGIVGLIFLLLVYFVPLKLFLSKMKKYHSNWKIKSYAMAGALIPMSYMDFSLTQVMFGHNIGVMMYVFPIAFFWAATRWAEREERELGNIA